MKQIQGGFSTAWNVGTRDVGSKSFQCLLYDTGSITAIYKCGGLHRSSLPGDVEAGVPQQYLLPNMMPSL